MACNGEKVNVFKSLTVLNGYNKVTHHYNHSKFINEQIGLGISNPCTGAISEYQ
jgi:hypothetical protein